MRLYTFLNFLTLVLVGSISYGAPSTKETLSPQPYKVVELENYGTHRKPKADFIFTTSAGYSAGSFLDVNENASQSFLGFNLRQNRFETGELDVWVTNKNLVGLFYGFRHQFGDDSVQVAYTKLSSGMYLSPDEGFVNFITIKRLQLRASLGWQNALDLKHRLHFEVGLGAALIGFEAFANLGWNWFF